MVRFIFIYVPDPKIFYHKGEIHVPILVCLESLYDYLRGIDVGF